MVDGCALKRIGDLPFQFYRGACTLSNLMNVVPLCRHVSRGLVAKNLPPGENHLTYRQSDRADSSLIQTQLRFLFSPSIVFSENKRSH